MSRPLKFKGALCATALAVMSLAAHADLARVGPTNNPSPPGHGFPLWYQDLRGAVLDLCLPDATDPGQAQMTACLQTASQPYTFPSLFPEEAFYFRGTSALTLPGGQKVVYVSALEAAFASGAATAGQQITFTRLRVTAGLPEVGNYLFYHPYGVHPETVDAVTGARDVVWSDDVGVSPGAFTGAMVSDFGPFLERADATGVATGPLTINGAQFLSDAAPTFVTGSPFGTNYFMVCGRRADGTEIPLGTSLSPDGNASCASTNQFTLTGRLRNLVANPVGSPLAIQSATYSRDAAGTHVNVGAQVARVLATQPLPLLTAASNQTPPVRMQGPDALARYFAQGFTDPSGTLPGQISVTNSADNPPTTVQAATSDVVTIVSASYNATTQTLSAVATSSDKGFGTQLPPTMAFDGFVTTAVRGGVAGDPAAMTLTATGVTVPPTLVVVHSTAGGAGRVDITTDPNLANPPGSPFTRDDVATVAASAPAIDIPVLANDLANVAAPINPASVTLVGGGVVPAALGTAAVNPDGTIRFTPGASVGTGTIKYVVSSAAVAGASNVGTVNLTVTEPVGGFLPLGATDTASVLTGGTVNINVTANDSGNGGTLVATSTQIVAGSVTGGTATVQANGTVNYVAGATPGAFGFNYTVANTNGNRSAPIRVNVTVANEPVGVTAGSVQCTRTGTRWRASGTGMVPNTLVTMYTTAVAPAAPTAAQTAGTATSLADGTWAIDRSGGPTCTATASLRTQSGTVRNNLAVRIR
ncbi:hypothetical protein BurJ1DRAFT_0026 [Burkholderiales bacterium JOSHI_001]|nr:hypothetical protein BurJ1DRAFT_0026 [Burkholderiales bacterium JOSHI_001]